MTTSPLDSTACERARDLIFSHLDAPDTRQSKPSELFFLESHLDACPACRNYQIAIASEIEALADLEPVPVPEGLSQRIMDRLLPEMEERAQAASSQKERGTTPARLQRPGAGQRGHQQRSSWRRSLPSMAAAALLLTLSWSISSSLFHGSQPTSSSVTEKTESARPEPANAHPASEAKNPEPAPVRTTLASAGHQAASASKAASEDMLDGQELAYIPEEDRVFDPEWPGSGSPETADKSVAANTDSSVIADIASEENPSSDSDDEILSPFAGF